MIVDLNGFLFKEGRDRVATAIVPLKEMIGYSPLFRQKTAGKGVYTMEFCQFVELRQ